MSWYSQYVTVPDAIEFKAGRYGLGGFAKRDLAGGHRLITVPYSSVLSETYALSTPWGRAVWQLRRHEAPVETTGRMVMYVVMIAEHAGLVPRSADGSALPADGAPAAAYGAWEAAPGDTRFGPYLRSLPVTYDDPLWWTEEQLTWLGPSNLSAGALHRRAWLRRIYDAILSPLVAALPRLFFPDTFTYPAFLWAHSAFASRGFPHILSVPPGMPEAAASSAGGGSASASGSSRHTAAADAPAAAAAAAAQAATHATDDPAVNPFSGSTADGPVGCMLPVADIFNHRSRARIAWIREAGSAATTSSGSSGATGSRPMQPRADKGGVTFILEEPVSAGDEVCNNYGAKSNEELILGFGFVLPHNILGDTYTLRLGNSASSGEGRDTYRWLVNTAALPLRHVMRQPEADAGADTAAVASASAAPDPGGSGIGSAAEQLLLPPLLMAHLRLAELTAQQMSALASALQQRYPAVADRTAALQSLLSQPISTVNEIRARATLKAALQPRMLALQSTLAGVEQQRLAEGDGSKAADCPGALDGAGSSAASEALAPVDGAARTIATAEHIIATAVEHASYRQYMAIAYLTGQIRILAAAITACDALVTPLAHAHAAAVASSAVSVVPPPGHKRLLPEEQFPGVVCNMYERMPADEATTGGGGAGSGTGAGGGLGVRNQAVYSAGTQGSHMEPQALLSVPLHHCLCAATLSQLAPALAEGLEQVDGLQLSQYELDDDDDKEDEDENALLDLSFLHLILLLVHLRWQYIQQQQHGSTGSISGKKRSHSETTSSSGGATSGGSGGSGSDPHPWYLHFVAAAENDFAEDAVAQLLVSGGDGSSLRAPNPKRVKLGADAEDGAAPTTVDTAASTRAAASAAAVWRAAESDSMWLPLYEDTVKAADLCKRLPGHFPPKAFTKAAFMWAATVVCACGVVLRVPLSSSNQHKTALQWIVPPIYPRLQHITRMMDASTSTAAAAVTDVLAAVTAADPISAGPVWRWDSSTATVQLVQPPALGLAATETRPASEWVPVAVNVSLQCAEGPCLYGVGRGAGPADAVVAAAPDTGEAEEEEEEEEEPKGAPQLLGRYCYQLL